jgi:hypothetical protein
VIRTEKRKAIDADGKPLFKPRRTQMAPVAWETSHHLQRLLYEAITDYAREGYNQSLLEKKSQIGFLMILMQRLVVSSTRAIRTTLERRLAVLEGTTDGHRSTPLYFPSSINSTNSEEKLWQQFWEGHGISRLDVAYQRGLGDGDAAGGTRHKNHPPGTA